MWGDQCNTHCSDADDAQSCGYCGGDNWYCCREDGDYPSDHKCFGMDFHPHRPSGGTGGFHCTTKHVPSCSLFECSASEIAKDHPTPLCEGDLPCDHAQCCDASPNPRCDTVQCSGQYSSLIANAADKACAGPTCTDAECCEDFSAWGAECLSSGCDDNHQTC